MKQLWLLLGFFCIQTSGFSQFVNSGASVTVQAGATLKVESNFVNENSGTFINNGTVEVTGNFTNSATMNSGATSTLIFSGTSNSNVAPGTAQFQNVTLAKTNANTTLTGNMVVNGVLNFSENNNKLVLNAFNVTMGNSGTVTGAGANKYVVATGTGRMIKPISANGTLVFEVGDNVAATNYSPISANITGTGYSSATVGVRLVNGVHPNKPGTANDYITRYWQVLASGITNYNNTLTGTYVVSDDVVGTQSLIDGAVWNGSVWSYTNSTNSGNTTTSSTSVLDTDFTGFTGRATFNLTAYMEGFMDGGSMRPVLLNSGVFGAVGSQCDSITIQLRNAAFPYGVAHSYKGVIGTNGQLECIFPAAAIGNNYYIAIKHRNALETWTANTFTFINNGSYNFSTGSGQAYGSNMTQVGGLWCLYSGNIDGVNPDDNIDLVDYPVWESDYNDLQSGYFRSDLNGDGNVDLIDYPYWEANYNNLISVSRP
ncbi:MAG: hypothetical protein WAT79_01480 [Saprospiraceae bacterium]